MATSPTDQVFDALVVGAGPAGSAAALALRRAGRSVLVVERDEFPRFHIGESLLPQSRPMFQRLGVLDRIDALDFTDKWGATFIDGRDGLEVVYDFAQFGGVGEKALQVDRARFDALMLDAVRDKGGVVERGSVRAVQFGADGAPATAEVVRADGSVTTHRAQWVVDASGRWGLLGKAQGVRSADPELSKVALYTHFRGVPRPEGRRAGDVRIVSAPDCGWMWLIPLANGVTSVGAVLDTKIYAQLERGEPNRMFEAALERFPATAPWFANAERLLDVRVESSFAYASKQYASEHPGYFLVGDAGSFIDPVFSSGVHLGMLSGEEAGDAIDAILRGKRRSRVVGRFDRTQRERYDFMREFVMASYTPGIRDLFFAPLDKFGMGRAVTTVLSGNFSPPFGVRFRIRLFYLFGRLQERRRIVPRRHGEDREMGDCEPVAEPVLAATERS